ncbi:MAG TPA: 5-oxoprolinase subunit PxpB [Puia sp.]
MGRGYKFMNKREATLLKNGNLLSYNCPVLNLSTPFSIFPLGDSAITIDLGNHIDNQLNKKALALHDWLQAHRFPGVMDIIMAYSSVSVFYDPVIVRSGKGNCPNGVSFFLRGLLEEAWEAVGGMADGGGRKEEVGGKEMDGMGPVMKGNGNGVTVVGGHFFRIPVCYEGEYGPDLGWVAREKGLSPEEVIAYHHSIIYQVYMIGFLPGFPYMGKTDMRLEIPRKDRPVPVVAGGVGIAGMQTGIYPLNSPGGWQIIGRTPSKLFDPASDPPVRLQAGDHVQFYPISREKFLGWEGGSLG